MKTLNDNPYLLEEGKKVLISVGREEDIGAHHHNMGYNKPTDWNLKMVSRRYLSSDELEMESALVYTRFLKSQN